MSQITGNHAFFRMSCPQQPCFHSHVVNYQRPCFHRMSQTTTTIFIPHVLVHNFNLIKLTSIRIDSTLCRDCTALPIRYDQLIISIMTYFLRRATEMIITRLLRYPIPTLSLLRWVSRSTLGPWPLQGTPRMLRYETYFQWGTLYCEGVYRHSRG